MPKQLLNNAKVTVNNVDLSYFAFALDSPDTREQVDVTGFNALGTREYLPGARDQTITVSFLQGYGSSEPHSVLWPLYQAGSLFPIYIQPDGAAVGTANPRYGGTAAIYDYNGINGNQGARAEIVATFRPAGTAGWTYLTT